MKLSQLQAEHKAWVDGMFPGQPPIIPAAGMVEEAGELLHAILAMEREKIWGPDPRYPNLRSDIADAIGDCVIYACSLCNASGWDFRELCCLAYDTDKPPLEQAVGIVSAAVTNVSHISYATTEHYIARLRAISHTLGYDFHICIVETWQQVKTRKR